MTKFNNHCQSTSYDYNLTGFYRNYASDITLEVIDCQTDTAAKLTKYLKAKFPSATLIANGPFILIGIDCVNTPKFSSMHLINQVNFKLQQLCREIWPISGSFGFAQTTCSQWAPTMLRISVGLEPIEAIIQQFEKALESTSIEFEYSECKNCLYSNWLWI